MEAYALVKDGRIWDCSTHPQDMIDWGNKILREEPEAVLEVKVLSRKDMDTWRGGV